MLPFADALIDHPQLKERIFALRETAQAFVKANSSFNLPAQAMRDISQTLEIFLSMRQACVISMPTTPVPVGTGLGPDRNRFGLSSDNRVFTQ